MRTLLLTNEQDVELLLTFAFIPARYDSSIVLGGALPGGGGAQVWTFVTYALLHADWTHYRRQRHLAACRSAARWRAASARRAFWFSSR